MFTIEKHLPEIWHIVLCATHCIDILIHWHILVSVHISPWVESFCLMASCQNQKLGALLTNIKNDIMRYICN